MKKFLTCFVVWSLLLGSLAGCTSTPSSTPSETPATASADQPTAPPETTEASVKEPSEMKIFFVTKLVGTQYWAVVEQGVKDACSDLGITDLTINGPPADSDVEKQIQILQDAISAKADAILLAPTDSTAMINPVNEAFSSGIPIICIDTILNSDTYNAALLTDNKEAGRICGETLIKKLQENGVKEDEHIQIAIQVSSMGSQTIADRVVGFNEYWDANAPEAWEVLNDAIKVNDGDIQRAINFGQDFITTYPDLKVLFSHNNGSTVGFATALKESGREDLIMLGFDFSDEVADLIMNTDLQVSTVLQKQYYMGYEGVMTAVGLIQGKQPAEKKIDTGVTVVDKNNVNSEEIQAIVNMGK